MDQKEMFVTEFDRDRLEDLISMAESFGDPHSRNLRNLNTLREELERAQIVSPKEVPSNVVTMNSRVLLRDNDTSEEMIYRLVFPNEADITSGSISILAPVGTAILGYKQGDVVEWPVPSGRIKVTIEKLLYQPEAAGDFHL